MRIGLTELAVIVILAIMIIKPDKLSDYAKSMGKAIRELKHEVSNVKDSASDIVEPITEVRESIDEIASDIKESVDK